jgi:solute carrier family 36 (proton-coupled amino acid transporter)
MDKWWYVLICCAIWVPLVMVRKIEVFSKFHIFGDVLIIITILVICAYAGYVIHEDNGFSTQGQELIDPTLWPNAIGFSVYAFEGVGMVLPVREVTADKENYFKVLFWTIMFIGAVYLFFSEFCLWSFGMQAIDSPLITDNLPPYAWWAWVIKVLFAMNLVISYPLIMHPANIVLESYLFGSWPKTRKR